MAGIILKNVAKVYSGEVRAVDNFNMVIPDREFVVFVGPSGCGKSTTLRMIAGLEDITEGEIFIGERKINLVPPKNRNIAMVFQSYSLYPHMTVYKNMAFAMKMQHVPKAKIDKRVRDTAELLGITHLLKRKPRALSGGESQRVALGRAMVRNPDVFLLDEPLSNLDAKLRTDMRAEIVKLHKRLETTFIYVTHDQTEAMTMGDRIVLMDKGHIMQIDSPKNMYDYPVNTFVAGFIGSPRMNFFDCEIKNEDGHWFAVCGENGEYRISLADADISEDDLLSCDGQKATLGIRPEHMFVSNKVHDGGGFAGGSADIVEVLGAETNIYVDFPGGIRCEVREFNDAPVFRGQEINLTFLGEKLHIFDAETGAAISGAKHRQKAAETAEAARLAEASEADEPAELDADLLAIDEVIASAAEETLYGVGDDV